MLCKKCGALLEENNNICTKCGYEHSESNLEKENAIGNIYTFQKYFFVNLRCLRAGGKKTVGFDSDFMQANFSKIPYDTITNISTYIKLGVGRLIFAAICILLGILLFSELVLPGILCILFGICIVLFNLKIRIFSIETTQGSYEIHMMPKDGQINSFIRDLNAMTEHRFKDKIRV